MFHTRTMSLTFSSHMIPRAPQIPNYGVDPSTPFLFTALWSTSPRTPRTSKFLLISWLNIFKVNRSTAIKLTISMILMEWKMQSETSSLQFMRLNGMLYLQIRKLTISGPRFPLNSPRVFLLLIVIPRRTYPSRTPSLSIKHHLFPPFRQNPKRRLTPSPNISTPRNPWTTTTTGPSIVKLANHTLRLLRCQPTHLTF